MKSGRGFTLIELLVAISLAAVIALLGTVLTRTSLGMDVRYQDRMAERRALRDAYRLVERYWSRRSGSGFRLSHGSLVFQMTTGEKGAAIRVGFVCQADGASGFALAVYRWPTLEIPAGGEVEEWPPDYGELLVPGLRRCGFGYLQSPPNGSDASAKWLEEWVQQNPPELIRLDLATASGALPPLIVSTESM